MWMNTGADTETQAPLFDAFLHIAGTDTATTFTQEQGVVVLYLTAGGIRSCFKPGPERCNGLRANRQYSFFGSFTAYLDGSVVKAEIAEVGANEFRKAQPRGVKQLEHRSITLAVPVPALN